MKNSKVRIDETSAGRCISAYIVLNKKGERVATIRAHYGNSLVRVEVWTPEHDVQTGRAGGGGYDKFTACLRGMKIDGIELNDHCGQNEQTKKLLAKYKKEVFAGLMTDDRQNYWNAKVAKIGASFANYRTLYLMNGQYVESYNLPAGVLKEVLQTIGMYNNIYLQSGLDKLRALGYRVHQAI